MESPTVFVDGSVGVFGGPVSHAFRRKPATVPLEQGRELGGEERGLPELPLVQIAAALFR